MSTQHETNPSLSASSGALQAPNNNNNFSNDEKEKKNPNRGNGTENPTTSDENHNKNVTSRPVHESLHFSPSQRDPDSLLTGTDLLAPFKRLTVENEFQSTVQQQIDYPGLQMAARNHRPRVISKPEQGPAAQEERNMWDTIKADMMRADGLRKESIELVKRLIQLRARFGNDWKNASTEQLDEVTAISAEGARLVQEEKKILREEPCDLLKNLELFSALRAASESDTRNSSSNKARNPKSKSKGDTDGAADSPGPAYIKPLTVDPSTYPDMIKEADAALLSGSASSAKDAKEPSVKTEEGSEGGKGPAEKAGKLFVGAEVAYKQAKMKDDGSQWIQCIIKSISDNGSKKRYEVQDPEPDDTGAPGQVYKTSAASLIAIPSSDAILAEYPVGKQVLARYPETTTFYHAEVTGMKKDICRLKFEDDQNQEMEVARRFVLELNTK